MPDSGWRIGLALTPTTTRPGWCLGLEFVPGPLPERPDPSAVRPGGSLPAAPWPGFGGVLYAQDTGIPNAALRPGGNLPLAVPGFAGQLAAASQPPYFLQPGGSLPAAQLVAFGGQASGFYAERHSLAPGGDLTPVSLPVFSGCLAAPYDSRVQRPLARLAQGLRFERAARASAALAAVFQDARHARAKVRGVVQQAQKLGAGVQAVGQQARGVRHAVQDTARQARPLRLHSAAAFEVAQAMRQSVRDAVQQAQRLPLAALVYAWQIAAPRRGQHLERFEQAGIQRHMGLRVPPLLSAPAGWRIALEFAPQFITPRTWAELQTGPHGSSNALAQRLGNAPAAVCWQDAMRPGPATVKVPWPPEGGGTDPGEPGQTHTYVIPLLKVYMQAHTVVAHLLPGMEPVVLTDIAIQTDDDSYCYNLSATGPEHLLDQLAPGAGGLPARVQVSIDGIGFVFAVTSVARSRAHARHRCQVQGISVTALLDAPYMPARAWLPGSDKTALQLILGALEYTGTAVDWQITDWLVPAGAFSHQGTPLQIILRVAGGVGAVVRSHREQEKIVIAPRYPHLPWKWAAATPDVQMPAAAIITDELRPEPRPAYNAVYVAGGPVGGVLGHIRRFGSAGNELAPAIQDDLITHADAARMRGAWALAASGNKLIHSINMPVRVGGNQPGILQPGQLLEVADIGHNWRGLVRGVSVSASHPVVRQQVTVERIPEEVAP